MRVLPLTSLLLLLHLVYAGALCYASSVSRPSPIVKRVFFVRHGHGEHNGAVDDALAAGLGLGKACLAGGAIRDPGLTPKGVGQCQALANDPILQKALAAGAGRAEVVVVSLAVGETVI